MGIYFEELPLLSQCAFEQVSCAAKNGDGVDPACYANEKEKRLTKAMQEYWGSCAYPKCPSQHPLLVAALA